jgi:serine/threonine-protein kinase
MFAVGERIADRYQVEAQIGMGGIAAVYRVRHVQLGSEHAMKVLLFQRKGLDERLLLEGRIQAQIRHPNVVTVTDVVEHQGRMGLLMEYVEGQSLQGWLEEHHFMSLELALPLFAQVLSGVGTAHAAGVLHRDIKPGNILLGRTPRGIVPKITDFGLAKVVLDGAPPGSTRDGSMMGTPGYMAPEQIRNAADTDLRADIFALAALLFDLLSGRPPFMGEPQEAMDQTLSGTYPPLDSLVPGLPASVAAAVHQALTTDRDRRFESCAAFAAAVFADRPDLLLLSGSDVARPLQLTGESAIPSRPASRATPTTPPSTTLAPGATAVPAATLQAPPPPQRLLPFVGAGLAGGLLVLAAVALVLQQMLPSVSPEPEKNVVQTTADAGSAQVTTPAEPTSAPSGELPAVAPSEGAASTLPAPTSPVLPLPGTTAVPVAKPETSATPPEPGTTAEPVPPGTEPPPAEAATTAPENPVLPAATEVPVEAVVVPVEPQAPPVQGSWSGTANGLNATLRITRQSGRNLQAELSILAGPTTRVSQLSGSIDPESGAIRLQEKGGEEMVLTGKLEGDRMAGTYMRAGQTKALAWEVRR